MNPKQTRLSALVGFVLAGWVAAAPARALPPLTQACQNSGKQLLADPERVRVDTSLGTMTLQLFPSVAPETVANFLGYIDRGDYVDTIFHRIVTDFVVQTGGIRSTGILYDRLEDIDSQEPVDNEPCISNVAGTIAMAKVDGDPNSATSQWFVNLGDNSANLDSQNGGFTVFGRVLGDGLDVAIAISELELALDEPLDPMEPEGPLALPDLPPFYAVVPQALWSTFRASPVQSLPIVDPPPAYGCFDSAQAGVVFAEDPQSVTDWEPDAGNDLPYTIVSAGCQGAGTGGMPAFSCSAPGRRVLRIDAETGAFVPDPTAPFFFAEVLMDCEDLAASEESLQTRREAIAAQLDTGFVRVDYTVPEPGPGLLAATSLLVLARLRSRPRRPAR